MLPEITYSLLILAILIRIMRRDEKERVQARIKFCRKEFSDSIAECGERLRRDDAIRKILESRNKKSSVPPIRKACGLFSDSDAQKLLK